MKTKLHIIIVNDFAHVNGGASQVALNSAISLAKSGYFVSLLTATGPIMHEIVDTGINTICLDQYDILHDPNRVRAMTQGIWNFKAARAMSDLLKSYPDKETIVHIHATVKSLSSSVIYICRKQGVPVIMTLHDYFCACPNGGFYDYQQQSLCFKKGLSLDCIRTNCDIRKFSHKFWRVIRNIMQKTMAGVPDKIEHFIYISELSLTLLKKYLPEKSNLYFVSNPIDVDFKDRITAENNNFFIFVGRLSKEKGIQDFCEVINNNNYPAIVVGDGELFQTLQQSYPNITFTGWLDNLSVEKMMKKSKALVFSSHCYETQGLIVYEALARGIPVIVPKHTSAAEAIRDGENGFLYSDIDISDLDRVLQKFNYLTYEEIAFMSHNAYEYYWKNPLNMKIHIDQLINIYNHLIK